MWSDVEPQATAGRDALASGGGSGGGAGTAMKRTDEGKNEGPPDELCTKRSRPTIMEMSSFRSSSSRLAAAAAGCRYSSFCASRRSADLVND